MDSRPCLSKVLGPRMGPLFFAVHSMATMAFQGLQSTGVDHCQVAQSPVRVCHVCHGRPTVRKPQLPADESGVLEVRAATR